MKSRNLFVAIFLVAGILTFNSCTKDKDPVKPEIDLTELGYENSKIAYAGSDLHIEAEIIAEGKMDKVSVEIHPEGGHEKRFAITLHKGDWEFDTTYTKFSGLKNTTFHEHIDIPALADTGHYHFHFIVTDMEGQQTIAEEEIEIRGPLM